MGRKTTRSTSMRKNQKTNNKALPENANRGNERKLKFRTFNSNKNMDENKPSRRNNVHI